MTTCGSAASEAISAKWRSTPRPKRLRRWLAANYQASLSRRLTMFNKRLRSLARRIASASSHADFFSRLTTRSLGYFLSRELSKHVGPNKKFAVIGDHSNFNAALDLHCREASRIIKEISAGWYGQRLRRGKQISQEEARKFAHVAFNKLIFGRQWSRRNLPRGLKDLPPLRLWKQRAGGGIKTQQSPISVRGGTFLRMRPPIPPTAIMPTRPELHQTAGGQGDHERIALRSCPCAISRTTECCADLGRRRLRGVCYVPALRVRPCDRHRKRSNYRGCRNQAQWCAGRCRALHHGYA